MSSVLVFVTDPRVSAELVRELNEQCKVYSNPYFTNSFIPAMDNVSRIVRSQKSPAEVEYSVDHFTDGLTDEQLQKLYERKYEALRQGHKDPVPGEGGTFAVLDARSMQDKTVIIWTKLGADDATDEEVNMYPERWEPYRVPFVHAFEMMVQLNVGNLALVYGMFTEERKSCIGRDGIYYLLEVYRKHNINNYGTLKQRKDG